MLENMKITLKRKTKTTFIISIKEFTNTCYLNSEDALEGFLSKTPESGDFYTEKVKNETR